MSRLPLVVVSLLVASGALLGATDASSERTGALQTNPIVAENARAGTTSWLESFHVIDAIEAYSSEISVAPGETVHFHVSTNPAELYHIHIYRLGWYGGAGAREVACIPTDCGHVSSGQAYTRPSPDSNGNVDAAWPVTDELRIPDDWVSGYYLARIELRSGDLDGKAVPVFFFVRAPATRAAAILVQVPVNTWQAYNPWGGKSLYDSLSVDGRANRVSFNRPIPTNFLQPLEWEIQLVRFLEREGYDVAYQTDVDTHRDPASLVRHRLVVVNGHDEYWTSAIRDAFDSARDASTNLAFMGANIGYWQVRFEDNERTVVGYKSFADPITDPRLQTVLFRQLTPPRPECSLLGAQWEEGKKSSGDGPRDFAVNAAALGDPWLAGTGMTGATTLPELVGPEWDVVSPSHPESCQKPGRVVFFHYDGAPSNGDAIRYVAPSGARVFSAGSLQFSWGLDLWHPPSRATPHPALPALQQFLRNALADMTRPAAPLSLRVSAAKGVAIVRVTRAPDPRIGLTILAANGRTLCSSAQQTFTCHQPGFSHHRRFAYAAVSQDTWGQSAPLAITAVAPNNPPTARVHGRRRMETGRRVVFVAAASDLDGDKLAYVWKLDGRRVGAAGRLLRTRFLRPGRHHVEVAVRDGHGGRAAARLVVFATRVFPRGRGQPRP
jgi:hypothetical protein